MKLSPECQERQALKVAYTKVASAIEVQLQLYSAAKPARGNRFREKQFRIGQRDVGKPCAIGNSQAKVFHKHRTGVGSLVTEMWKRLWLQCRGWTGSEKKWGWLAQRVLRAGEWASAKLPNQTVVVSQTLQERYRSRYSNR